MYFDFAKLETFASALAKKYWIDVPGLDSEYAAVMSMLYMINAKTVTHEFEQVMGRKPHTFEEFAATNLDGWR